MDRFETVYSQRDGNFGDIRTLILKDTKTGVLYLCRENNKMYFGGVGLVVLVDRDGKPLTETYQVTI